MMRKVFKRVPTWFLAAAPVLLASSAVLADVTLPHVFAAGTPIKAAEVNANFAALNTGKQDKIASFVHKGTAANITGNYTSIDNAATNNKPNALLFVTGNKTPPGGATIFHAGSVSVQYNTTTNKWNILHDVGNSDPILVDEAWNVMVLTP